MPAKTPAKKASPARKSSAKKSTTRASTPHKNGVATAAQVREAALQEQINNLTNAVREREEQLRMAQEQSAALQAQLAEAPKADQLREMQARLTTRQAELEAARAEAANLRDQVARLRGPGEAGNLRCPRCGGHMTESNQDSVKSDRCDQCSGVFFDKGELATAFDYHDKQRDAGRKGFFSGIFGPKK